MGIFSTDADAIAFIALIISVISALVAFFSYRSANRLFMASYYPRLISEIKIDWSRELNPIIGFNILNTHSSVSISYVLIRVRILGRDNWHSFYKIVDIPDLSIDYIEPGQQRSVQTFLMMDMIYNNFPYLFQKVTQIEKYAKKADGSRATNPTTYNGIWYKIVKPNSLEVRISILYNPNLLGVAQQQHRDLIFTLQPNADSKESDKLLSGWTLKPKG